MLSVIVDAQGAEDRLPGLFAALTPAAVEGLVREVLVAGAARTDLAAEAVDALCQDMGAETVGDLAVAVAKAKSDWLLVAPAAIRLREGWVERLKDHMAGGAREARIQGLKESGLFGRRPEAMLITRARASGQSTLDAIGRKQGSDRVRLD